MPGLERKVNSRFDSPEVLLELESKVLAAPGSMGTTLDVFNVFNPHPDKYVLGWADPEKLQAKLARGSEIVTAEMGAKLYKIPDEEKKGGNYIKRRNMILVRTPKIVHEARMSSMALSAIYRMNNAVEAFNDLEGSRVVDESGRVQREKRGKGRPFHQVRPENAHVEDAIAEQNQRMEQMQRENAVRIENLREQIASAINAQSDSRKEAQDETQTQAAEPPGPQTETQTPVRSVRVRPGIPPESKEN